MTTLVRELTLDIDAARAWDALRDPGNAAKAFAGVLTDAVFDGKVRTVTFANGAVVEERIVSIDEPRMRLVYCIGGGRFEHYQAAIQIIPTGSGRCRFVWICDLLPDEAQARVEPLMDAGCAAFVRNVVG
jgi:carbon monoxide dehydrogenase subunit G